MAKRRTPRTAPAVALDHVAELEARNAILEPRIVAAQQAETNWMRSSMAQERRAIRAEVELQALRDRIRALLEPDGMAGRGA